MATKALDLKNRPLIRLDQAQQLAQRALGRDSSMYFCVSAVASTPNGMTERGWTLVFGSRSGKPKWVVVLASQRVIVLPGQPSESA